MLVFDIETAACADDQIRQFCPEFVPPAHPGEFDVASVKYGNLKDEAKRAMKRDECRDAHAAAVANYAADVEAKRAEHWERFKANAALDPLTGQIIAIGF